MVQVDAIILLTEQGNVDHIIYPRFFQLLERCGGTEEGLKNIQLPSASEIKAMILKAQIDSKDKLNKL